MGALIIICLQISASGIYDWNTTCPDAILDILGEADVENLDADLVEQMTQLYEHPLDLNRAGKTDLEETGIFTSFQLNSLVDYRERHGEILTLAELSLIDGFTEDIVRRLAPFIQLPSASSAVNSSQVKRYPDSEFASRAAYKDDFMNERTASYGVKYRMSFSDRFQCSAAASKSHGTTLAYPDVITGNFVWKHRYGKVVVGDFNARFGQGLCVWNTMLISSLNNPSSYMRKPSGVYASNSFTGSSAMSGLASEISCGKWRTTLMLSVPGLKNIRQKPENINLTPMINVSKYFKSGHIAMTHSMTFSNLSDYRIPQMKTSIDASLCLCGVNVFGEVMYDWVQFMPASIAGVDFTTGERWRIAGLIRYVPTQKEHGIAAGAEFNSEKLNAVLSLDVLYSPVRIPLWLDKPLQLKLSADLKFSLSDQMILRVSLSERVRTWEPSLKPVVRLDCSYGSEPWVVALRLQTSNFSRPACLGYVEAGCLSRKLSAYLRFGMFAIDSWDDRIYVYERDAPGNFNVPAFYRRGWWASSYLGWKYSRQFRLYLRISYKKPGKAELKLQSVLHF